MDERKTIYLDDAIDLLEELETKRLQGDVSLLYAPMIKGLKALPSADQEAAIVKVLKMVEEYKEKTGTDEIIIMPKNGMKAWDENGVEYTMQPTCNNIATDTISRQAAIAEFSCCELTPDGGIDANYAIDFLKQLPSTQPEQRWIPCSERLLGDDEYAEVLCCDTHKNYIVGYPFADSASETGYSAESDGVYMYDCIAWMPCPEPYRAERREE